jgi:hypothetical protein
MEQDLRELLSLINVTIYQMGHDEYVIGGKLLGHPFTILTDKTGADKILEWSLRKAAL